MADYKVPVADRIKVVLNELTHNTLGGIDFNAGILKQIYLDMAEVAGINLDEELPEAVKAEPAPAPALVNVASPTGAQVAVQPGFAQPEGARVANSGSVFDNAQAGVQSEQAHADAYAPAFQQGGVPGAPLVTTSGAGVERTGQFDNIGALIQRLADEGYISLHKDAPAVAPVEAPAIHSADYVAPVVHEGDNPASATVIDGESSAR